MGLKFKARSKQTAFTHGCLRNGHDVATHEVLAKRFANLLGFPFGGPCERTALCDDSYLIPRNTLSGPESATRYRIRSESDLLGGWVPEAFMATKAILHPLVSSQAAAPPDWPGELVSAAKDVTLPGFTIFSASDAIAAGTVLLRDGPVRLKPIYGKGGQGQIVVSTPRALEAAISRLVPSCFANGLVFETDLSEVTTYTAGQLRLPGLTISYYGEQLLTTDNSGRPAYGGTRLIAVPGGYDDLPANMLPWEMHQAADHAARFDRLADRFLPGLIASRRNYDIASGRRSDGTWCMGVIDQSWRVGGATGAELVAVEALLRNAGARAVRARSVEAYGGGQLPPEGTLVCFQGDDPATGPLLKFSYVEEIVAG